ncbi:hypothetical protein ABH927_004015 [Planotetraspora sp. GP83]
MGKLRIWVARSVVLALLLPIVTVQALVSPAAAVSCFELPVGGFQPVPEAWSVHVAPFTGTVTLDAERFIGWSKAEIRWSDGATTPLPIGSCENAANEPVYTVKPFSVSHTFNGDGGAAACFAYGGTTNDGRTEEVSCPYDTWRTGWAVYPADGDLDGDGVPNNADACFLQPGPVANHGCPEDAPSPTPSDCGKPTLDLGPEGVVDHLSDVELTAKATFPAGSDPTAYSYTWRKITGPGSVTFAPNQVGTRVGSTLHVNTTASFSRKGTYTLEFEAKSGDCAASKTLTLDLATLKAALTLSPAGGTAPLKNVRLDARESQGATTYAFEVRRLDSAGAPAGDPLPLTGSGDPAVRSVDLLTAGNYRAKVTVGDGTDTDTATRDITVSGLRIVADHSDAHQKIRGAVVPATGACPVSLTVESIKDDSAVWNALKPVPRDGATLPPGPEATLPKAVDPNGAAALAPQGYGSLTWPNACFTAPDQVITVTYDLLDPLALNAQYLDYFIQLVSLGTISTTGLQYDYRNLAAFQRGLRGDARRVWDCLTRNPVSVTTAENVVCALPSAVRLVSDPAQRDRLLSQLATVANGLYITEETRRAYEAISQLNPADIAKYAARVVSGDLGVDIGDGQAVLGAFKQQEAASKALSEAADTAEKAGVESLDKSRTDLQQAREVLRTAGQDRAVATRFVNAEKALATCQQTRPGRCANLVTALNAARQALVPVAQRYQVTADSAALARITAFITAQQSRVDALVVAVQDAIKAIPVLRRAATQATRALHAAEALTKVAVAVGPLIMLFQQTAAYLDARDHGALTGAVYFVACGPESHRAVCRGESR